MFLITYSIITTMPFRCVHNCPKNFKTSCKVSLTHHQAQCPAYSAQRIAVECLRATQSNDTKQRIAVHRKFKSMVCHGCHYQCYCQSECMIQLFPGSQVSWYGRIICQCPMSMAAASCGIDLSAMTELSFPMNLMQPHQ